MITIVGKLIFLLCNETKSWKRNELKKNESICFRWSMRKQSEKYSFRFNVSTLNNQK
jgi:hypothetical protein